MTCEQTIQWNPTETQIKLEGAVYTSDGEVQISDLE